jgi:hypothetical protein
MRYDPATNKIAEFINSNKDVPVQEVEAKAGLPKTTLSHVLAGRRNIPEGYLKAIIRELEKYGFKYVNPDPSL